MKFLLAVVWFLWTAIARGADLPTPVILDTDIGTDVDHAYALVLAARRPEIDLVGVPVAAGHETVIDGHEAFWIG